ncbi:hypothetical protein [Propionicimonas paludicola]|nr:hypothetical protein [Propionicimonas paludicola]
MENDLYTEKGHLSCTATESKTDRFTVSVKVSGEVGNFLFAKADVEVGGEIQHEVTTGYVTTGDMTVPARTIMYCDRGTVRDKFAAHYTDTNCSSSGCAAPVRHNFTITSPVTKRWWFHSERI